MISSSSAICCCVRPALWRASFRFFLILYPFLCSMARVPYLTISLASLKSVSKNWMIVSLSMYVGTFSKAISTENVSPLPSKLRDLLIVLVVFSTAFLTSSPCRHPPTCSSCYSVLTHLYWWYRLPPKPSTEERRYAVMAETTLSTFPENKIEAIAYLYVQKKQYQNPTPSQLAEDYMHAYKEVRNFFASHRGAENWR